jgi:DNA (cytosine-5)-methyltransferase 1
MLRVIEIVRPRWVVGENVRGFVSMEMGLERSISDLEAIGGYAVQAFVLPACAVDAPHRRDRVWIMAHSKRSCGGVQPGSLAGTEGAIQKGGEQFRPRPQARNGGAYVADTDNPERRRRTVSGTSWDGQPSLDGEEGHVADADCGNGHGRGGSLQMGRKRGKKKAEENGVPKGIQWRPKSDVGGLADGLSTGLAGWPGEPEGVPRVATGVQNRVDKLRALGNAVVPQIPEIIGRAILTAEGK